MTTSLQPSGTAGATPAPGTKGLRDLLPRLFSGVVMIVLALAALWRGGDIFVGFWMIVALAVMWEWQRLIDAPNEILRVLTGTTVVVAGAYLTHRFALEMTMIVSLIGAGVLARLAGPGKRAWAAFGLVYATALVVAVTLLRLSLFDGLEAILFLFAVVWGTDIFAYFGGRMIGGPKLWPSISPAKTWAGFMTGIFCGALLGVAALDFVSGLESRAVLPIALLGGIAGLMAQAGDLFESAVKRHFGVKDSSHLIPGHGGFMDRLDGFIAAAVFAACVGYLRAGPASVAIGLLRW